jgi:hypothetical protein
MEIQRGITDILLPIIMYLTMHCFELESTSPTEPLRQNHNHNGQASLYLCSSRKTKEIFWGRDSWYSLRNQIFVKLHKLPAILISGGFTILGQKLQCMDYTLLLS